MDKLTEDFEKSLFNNSKEILGEYIELGIDSFINDGILKDIPIVNSIVAVLKIGKNIHDRNLLRQTLTFINEFNSGNISKDKLNISEDELMQRFVRGDKSRYTEGSGLRSINC